MLYKSNQGYNLKMKYTIKNGLPSSHGWNETSINKKRLKGIIWKKSELKNKNTLILYKNWAKVFFESDWYEIGTGTASDSQSTKRDIQLLKTMLKNNLSENKIIIDVHCGSGRHLLELGKEKIYGIGMEGSDLLRNDAKKKANKANLPIKIYSTSNYIKNKLKHKADIVTTLFNSMGYTFTMHDDFLRFKWIVNLIKPGGLYLLDIRDEDYQIKKFSTAQTLTEKFKFKSTDNKKTVTINTTKFWSNKNLAVEKEIKYQNKTVQHVTYGWKTYSKQEIISMLKKLDMEYITSRLDFYTSPNNYGERIIMLFKKN